MMNPTDCPGANIRDFRAHSLRPLVLDAATAHRAGQVTYDADCSVTLRHSALQRFGLSEQVTIPPERQFPAIRATFDDLNKALSRLANSPLADGQRTLRDLYDDELERYEQLVADCVAAGGCEPDYGSYVFDHKQWALYLVAPERWHRLALVTSNSKLLVDPERQLTWRQIRDRLEGAVVGFAGASVGGNLLEGWLREGRPRRIKVADPDWVELTNFNRGERMSLRHLVGNRAQRFDIRNPYDVSRVSKAEYIAYESQLVDPYLDVWVYNDGLKRDNIERFLHGDGGDEPAVDILVEEMDNLELKVLVRNTARAHGVDVFMATDFGHRTDLLWNNFRQDRTSNLGKGATDAALTEMLAATRTGDRAKLFDFVTGLVGPDYASDAFEEWMLARGEQPTSSMPQSGATAMAAGGIGGKELALRILGHGPERSSPERVVYDFLARTVTRS